MEKLVYLSKNCSASAWETPFSVSGASCGNVREKMKNWIFRETIDFFQNKCIFRVFCPKHFFKSVKFYFSSVLDLFIQKKLKNDNFSDVEEFFFNFSPYQVQCEFQLALNSNNSGWMLSSVENLVLLACVFSSKEVRARTPCKQDGYCCLTN